MANKLKNTAIVIKIAITKSGTDAAVTSGIKITTQGMKPSDTADVKGSPICFFRRLIVNLHHQTHQVHHSSQE